MIAHQLALVRRELWEHRSIYVTPVAIALMCPWSSGDAVFASGFAQNSMSQSSAHRIWPATGARSSADGILPRHVLDLPDRLAILTVFYCLDSLYAERKDKSILFWRSLPVTDAETVLSKLLTAVFVIPLSRSSASS